jgi:predicted component of type VI protein secretion system
VADLNLEIVEGPSAGRRVPLDQPLVVGRGQDAQVVLDDPRASRRHARISPHGGTAIVEDLDSSNGTFVNGNELYTPATIGPGDDILIGVTVMELRTAAQIAVQPSAVRPVPEAIAAVPAAPPAPPPPTPPPQPAPAAPPLAATPRLPPPMPASAQQQVELNPELAALVDTKTRRRAQAAPFALFALVVLVVIVYLALK